MGRSLLDAAQSNQVHYSDASVTPVVTMLLPRLDLSPTDESEFDPRIPQTINILREWGLIVRVGEEALTGFEHAGDCTSVQSLPQHVQPTTRINLDLSLLIALVSDLTHSSLPSDEEDAKTRFIPSEKYRQWKNARIAAGYRTDAHNDGPEIKHSRALTTQVLQEMHNGLLQEIHDRLSRTLTHHSIPGESATHHSIQDSSISAWSNVEFWTTPDARDRCLRIVQKIGGTNEKRRVVSLFPDIARPPLTLERARDMYWENSRYEPAFLPLIPIRVFPQGTPGSAHQSTYEPELPPFFISLRHACLNILARGILTGSAAPHGCTSDALNALQEGSSTDGDGEIEPAAVTAANPKLTVHTVQSMLWGSSRGWTTMTANRGSIKIILKHMQSMTTLGGPPTSAHAGCKAVAAVWTAEPRSLAEGMRSDFQE
jgi:hypothetical protein